MAENSAIIVDLGGKDIKAGYASGWPTEEEPRLVRLTLFPFHFQYPSSQIRSLLKNNSF
jgi:hypothetical protein